MGNGPSSRRNGRYQHNTAVPPPPPHMVPPPSGYPGAHAPHPGSGPFGQNGHHAPYFYPPNYNGAMIAPMGPQFYPPGYMPANNGQFMMNHGFRPASTPPPQQHQPHAPSSVSETQKANTIRNDVNLNKSTLRLEKDEENPGFHLVAFSFDATVAGSISVFFLAREVELCGFTPLKPQLFKVTRVPFEKGLCQKFRQAPGSGVNLARFDGRDLSKEGEDDVYPLIVRTETMGKDPPANVSLQDSVPIDAPLPKWVHCQTTQAVLEKKGGDFKVRVVRQTLLVDGMQYELQEIYGMENSGPGGGFDDSDEGKECVICMSEPRDTTVLPCRHMCMCSECATALRNQTNRCPICRTPVERLLEIKVSKPASQVDQGSSNQGSSRHGAGQSSSGSSQVTMKALTGGN